MIKKYQIIILYLFAKKINDDNFRLYIIEGIAESGLQRLYILIKNDP